MGFDVVDDEGKAGVIYVEENCEFSVIGVVGGKAGVKLNGRFGRCFCVAQSCSDDANNIVIRSEVEMGIMEALWRFMATNMLSNERSAGHDARVESLQDTKALKMLMQL